MSKNLFETHWSATKTALCEGLTGNRKKVMEVVLENTKKDLSSKSGILFESATNGSTSAGNVATLNKVILPVIRRVMPTVIANEIIGVQPMTGPVGQIHTLRVRYADTFGAPSGVSAGAEALSPFEIARFYSGNGDSANPKAATTSVLEGTAGKRLNIQVLKET